MSQGNLETGRLVRRLLTILRIVGAPLLLLIVLLRVDLGEIGTAFSHMRSLPFFAAVFLLVVNFAVQLIKWRYLLSSSANVSRGDLFRSLVGGYAFVLTIPGQMGEFSRALFIPGESKLKVMGLVAMDKLSGFSIILLASGFSLAVLHAGLFYLLPLAIVGLFALLTLRPQLLTAGAKNLSSLFPWGEKAFHFLEGFQTLNSRRMVTLLLLSLLLFLIYATQFYLLISAFEAVELRTMGICFPLVMLVNSLPITMGGLGLREGAAVLFFTRFGVQGSSALGAALLLFTINILIPGLCGLVFIHQIGSKSKPLTEKSP